MVDNWIGQKLIMASNSTNAKRSDYSQINGGLYDEICFIFISIGFILQNVFLSGRLAMHINVQGSSLSKQGILHTQDSLDQCPMRIKYQSKLHYVKSCCLPRRSLKHLHCGKTIHSSVEPNTDTDQYRFTARELSFFTGRGGVCL